MAHVSKQQPVGTTVFRNMYFVSTRVVALQVSVLLDRFVNIRMSYAAVCVNLLLMLFGTVASITLI